MIEYNGVALDAPSIELTTAPSPDRRYSVAVKRRSFYRRHELAIWVLLILSAALFLVYGPVDQVLWYLSTPFVRFMP